MNEIELSNSSNKNEENLSIQLNLDKNGIIEKRKIIINYTTYLKIPYFHFGNTIAFYFPYSKIDTQEFKYPPFSLGEGYKQFLFMIIIGFISYIIVYILLIFLFNDNNFQIITPIIVSLLLFNSLILLIINPGYIYKSINYSHSNVYYCNNCSIVIERGMYTHCYSCNCCCWKLDHHCGVVGTCISRKNIIFFYSLILLVGIINSYYILSFFTFLSKYYQNK